MKRWIGYGSSFAILIIVPLYVWYYFQSPVQSGIYPEKHAGSLVLDYDGEEKMLEFEFPVRWIKKHPWEREPIINEVKLIDEDGSLIGSISGEYRLEQEEESWYKRNVRGKINFYLNGKRFTEEYGINSYAIEEEIKREYTPKELILTTHREQQRFLFEDRIKILLLETAYEGWSVQGGMFHFKQDLKIELEPEGYIVRLAGPRGEHLEEINYWLPGMEADYHTKEVLYSFDNTIDDYLDDNDTFIGEPMSFPLHLTNNELFIYFPLTEAILNETSQSLVHFVPYFTFSTKEGESYHSGGTGSTGTLDWDSKWEAHIIRPEK